jgi:hypothetical protein
MTAQTDALIEEVRVDMNRLRGKLFQLVESWDVGEKRENAMKGCIRSETYHAQSELESMIRRGS